MNSIKCHVGLYILLSYYIFLKLTTPNMSDCSNTNRILLTVVITLQVTKKKRNLSEDSWKRREEKEEETHA